MTRADKRRVVRDFAKGFTTLRGPAPDGYKYNGLAAVVYGEGVELSNEPFTPDEEALLLALFRHARTPKPKHCYETAYDLASFGSVGYGEGWGVSDKAIGIPIEHAVGVLNGKPVDISWRSKDEPVGHLTRSPKKLLARAKANLANNLYHVIVFPYDYVCKVLSRTGTYGVVEFNGELVKHGTAVFNKEVTANG